MEGAARGGSAKAVRLVLVDEREAIGARGISILFASGDQGVWGRSGRGSKFHPDFPGIRAPCSLCYAWAERELQVGALTSLLWEGLTSQEMTSAMRLLGQRVVVDSLTPSPDPAISKMQSQLISKTRQLPYLHRASGMLPAVDTRMLPRSAGRRRHIALLHMACSLVLLGLPLLPLWWLACSLC